MLSSKWKRIAIGAGGMYVELVLASFATFGWWFSEPGLLNHVCLQIMFVSSVSTLMFNGNPLLRYDGYYILSDLVEIPNLQQKASAILNHLLAQKCLGMELPLDPFMPRRHHALFALYTVASAIYRWVVLFSILWFLNEVLEPYGLKVLGQTVAVLSIGMMVLQPLVRLVRFFRVPGRMQQVKTKNLLAMCGCLSGVFLAAFVVPWPHYAGCPLEVRPRDVASIYVQVPAKLKEVLVSPGERVQAGQVLARCESLDLELKIAELTGQRQSYQAQVDSLMQRRFAEPKVGEELATLEEALSSVESQLQQQLHAQELLELRATRSGVILLSSKEIAPARPEKELPTRQGTLLDKKNLGAVVPAGMLFCQIGELSEMEVELYVDQSDLDFVRIGQKVYLRIDNLPGETFVAQLTALAQQEVEAAPKSLSNQAGGTLAVRTDAAGVARPLSSSYTARAPLMNSNHQLQSGLRGWARIQTGNQTLAKRLWRYLTHTFHFQI
jgi:putative peptide zinc metalloprotease protein